MRQLIITLLVGFMTFGIAVDNADARRFGGGASMGHYSRSSSATSGQKASTPRQAPASRPAAAGNRFMGPMAGLLAGGLIGALFFGGAFNGLRFADILLIALVIFGIYLFMRSRRHAYANQQQGNQQYQQQQSQQHAQQFNTAQSGGGSYGTTPEWFNRERFLEDAKAHFETLQKAWDDNSLSDIQDYVTPELYNLLRQERAKQPDDNSTEVIKLFAELGDIQQFDQKAEASVLFHGVIKENGEQNEFSEVWHLVRDVRDQAPWYIQGIEQR
ncbi:Tim44 domain-containing protein [Carnimonas bestiolae]|uniref:Tim44 domain-containing protein n=1 Tax=Carnimonas bestiolae TaxID=3402172 RepID=UPI003EDC1035